MTEKEIIELIRERAYDKWQLRDLLCESGSALNDWLEAEKEIKSSLFIKKYPYTREDEG